MKKVVLIGMLTLLCACSTSAKSTIETKLHKGQFQLEENAILHVRMDDEDYARELKKLWNKTYPKAQHALNIEVQPYTFSQTIEADVSWIKDSDVMYIKTQAASLNQVRKQMELKPVEHMQRSFDDQIIYIPIEGQGSIFAWNEQELKKRGFDDSQLETFESIRELGDKSYYHNHYAPNVYPLLFQDYEIPSPLLLGDLFQEEDFTTNVESYRELYNLLELVDDPSMQHTFLENGYLSGMLDTTSIISNSKTYQEGSYHFAPMPSYKGQTLTPYIETFGFVINKDTSAPNLASAFVQLTRSEEGVKALLSSTSKLPLVEEEYIDSLDIYDSSKKEMMATLLHSELQSEQVLKNKPSIKWMELYQESDFLSMLQNYICSDDKTPYFQKQLHKNLERWVYIQ